MLIKINSLIDLFPNIEGHSNKRSIEQVTTDSREKTTNSLFVPIKGERFNGHDFLQQAIQNGAIATLWQENERLPEDLPENLLIFFVKDTLHSLQQLAHFYRKQINPKVIGITGSNGKTTTKDIVKSILQTTYKTHATKGNLNNDIGLPLTILSMPAATEVLVAEMGMNNFNEIKRLTKIAQPDYAVITNIGESHIEHLKSREGIAKAKLEIIEGLKDNGTLIIDGDEPLLKSSIQLYENVLKCGLGNNNDMIVTNIRVDENGTVFTLDDYLYEIPLYGRHHALNATFAIALSKQLKITNENIHDGLRAIKQTDMRFQFLKSSSGATLINDAYNASPTSMIGAISVLKQFDKFRDKVVVLGDILELGKHAEDLHLSVAKEINRPITKLYTYGNFAKLITDDVKIKNNKIESKHFSTKEQLITHLKTVLHDEMIVLFKASRGMAFETIIEEII